MKATLFSAIILGVAVASTTTLAAPCDDALIDSSLILFNTDPTYVLPGMPSYDRLNVHQALGSEGPTPALRISLRDQIILLMADNVAFDSLMLNIGE